MAKLWKKGRGKLGPLAPLLGSWIAESDTPMGPNDLLPHARIDPRRKIHST